MKNINFHKRSRYYQKYSILPNGRVVLQFKIERRPWLLWKTQDLNLNKTRILQKFAHGPGPGRAREKAEIYFYFSEGRLGPPHVYMRGPVRARARARAKYKQEKKFCSQQAASGPKMQTQKFWKKNFRKKNAIFKPAFSHSFAAENVQGPTSP